MSALAYRFEIDPLVPLADAEMSLRLAMIALEGLFGPSGIRLDAHYRTDEAGRAIVIDSSTRVGRALVRVFTTLLSREFGDDRFVVQRLAAGEDNVLTAAANCSPAAEVPDAPVLA
jgi:hypothetical protein